MLKTFPNTSTTDKTGILRKIPQKMKSGNPKKFKNKKAVLNFVSKKKEVFYGRKERTRNVV